METDLYEVGFFVKKSTFTNKKPNISTNLVNKYSIMIRDNTRQ